MISTTGQAHNALSFVGSKNDSVAGDRNKLGPVQRDVPNSSALSPVFDKSLLSSRTQ